ncbi:MAG: hypothetical protein PHP53_07890 [Prolixibacteraceae bacterium]|nr:hypothetical protein [Prolixibacteraceae bacterium]
MAEANVYYFNPTCELAVANGSFSYQPPLLLQEMERDLSILPFAFCTENDFVLTENQPTLAFQQKMRIAGFTLPQFCNLAELESLPSNSFDAIYPWGWSPAAHFKLKNLKEKCIDKFRESPVFNWKDEHKLLFERSTSLDFLNGLLANNPPDWFIKREMIGSKATSCEEIELLLRDHSPLVLKAPMSSSGRGIQIIRNIKLNTSNKQWISGILKQQSYLIAEPYLEKLIDLSFQFRVLSNSKIEYLGFSIFETNSNGQYRGTLIHPDLGKIAPDENVFELMEMISATAKIISDALKKSNYANWHRGFLGVDAMIFKHQKDLLMQPCIEINSRMNMGVLTMFIEKQIHPDATGKFELFYGKTGDFETYALKQMQLKKPQFSEGRLYSGFVALVEPSKQNKFGAYISLGEAK